MHLSNIDPNISFQLVKHRYWSILGQTFDEQSLYHFGSQDLATWFSNAYGHNDQVLMGIQIAIYTAEVGCHTTSLCWTKWYSSKLATLGCRSKSDLIRWYLLNSHRRDFNYHMFTSSFASLTYWANSLVTYSWSKSGLFLKVTQSASNGLTHSPPSNTMIKLKW